MRARRLEPGAPPPVEPSPGARPPVECSPVAPAEWAVAIALILAAGAGERLGAHTPKAFVPLAGRPLVQWSVDALAEVAEIERIVVALPPGAGAGAPAGTVGVVGGAARSQSVARALAAAGGGEEPVLVHDAARPLVSAALARAVLHAATRPGVDGAVAAARVTDTVKRAEPAGDGAPRVAQTLERAGLWAVQTPQVFRRGALERALDVPEEVLTRATDDAWLVERAGGTVVLVEAPRENLKVTTPLDLALAELLIARAAPPPPPGPPAPPGTPAPPGAPAPPAPPARARG
ncbi:MAG: 2-C-methyl-D-erythritol 4-phosphate cytidylyltransferase [Solirubrobacterales bacterium]|nr:2-C-methyl-D-erythritol 4-phosphate cytidylyltransferase [Solirubrobacterales bacterium]